MSKKKFNYQNVFRAYRKLCCEACVISIDIEQFLFRASSQLLL